MNLFGITESPELNADLSEWLDNVVDGLSVVSRDSSSRNDPNFQQYMDIAFGVVRKFFKDNGLEISVKDILQYLDSGTQISFHDLIRCIALVETFYPSLRSDEKWNLDKQFALGAYSVLRDTNRPDMNDGLAVTTVRLNLIQNLRSLTGIEN